VDRHPLNKRIDIRYLPVAHDGFAVRRHVIDGLAQLALDRTAWRSWANIGTGPFKAPPCGTPVAEKTTDHKIKPLARLDRAIQ